MTHDLFKHRLYVIIFGTDTPAGKMFDLLLIVAILASLGVLMLESIPHIQARWGHELRLCEYTFTGLFTVEYALRLYCSQQRKAYAKSFYGIVDLLAIMPTYLTLLFPSASYMSVIRLLRVLRIFQILKLMRYLQDSNLLLRSLAQSRRKIFIFFSSVAILVTIFGTLIFIIEGPEHGFTSLPISIYWAVVTITTVGYGDLVPQTPLGQALAAVTMLLGYSIIAVPTGIITAQLSHEIHQHRQLIKCPNCGRSGHDADAEYCKYCGSELEHKATQMEQQEKTQAQKKSAG